MTSFEEVLISVMKDQGFNRGMTLEEVQECTIRALCELTEDEVCIEGVSDKANNDALYIALTRLDGMWVNAVEGEVVI